ncbi:tRNA-dihydrouridine synthase [Micrococcus sp. M4NT]|uniref:tRNA-dihydrouridine synthase n=1 Tax=Micrococcus sp. M4NT TaxID=2957501 RepID=UPI0029AA4BFC|nr:tRNA-dihydrouridine synthase [Micrococcus sp. M4NT]MDX2340748.1 tRNA-dihydrouridine synthase [Micrococcus sp. M4NT]
MSDPAPALPAAAPVRQRRRSSKALALGGTLMLAAAMTGCSSPADTGVNEVDGDYAQVCRDEATQERVPDERCEEGQRSGGGGGFGWFFIPLIGGRTVPAVGAPVRAGTAVRPTSGVGTRVPAAGGEFAKAGTVSKGGFGTKGGGAGS